MAMNLLLGLGSCIAAWAMLRLLGNERERIRSQTVTAAPPPTPAAAERPSGSR